MFLSKAGPAHPGCSKTNMEAEIFASMPEMMLRKGSMTA